MADIEKHRLEVTDFAHEFEDQLATGDSLTGTPTVVVLKETTTGWSDVTSEFGTTGEISPAISGTTVTYQLQAAGTGEQAGGVYRVRITCPTTDGETLVAEVEDPVSHELRRPTLRVQDDADANAP